MTRSAGALSNKCADFLLQEYERLTHEIELLIKESRALERNVVIAVGGTWGFLFSADKHTPPDWAYFIPFLFAILGAIRAYGIESCFGQYGAYIAKIEEAFWKDGAPDGWEHNPRFNPQDSKGAVLFWALLIASTFGVAIAKVCKCF